MKGLSPVPLPGSRPVTVTREVPLTILSGEAGPAVVDHSSAEPCYACACCALWARSLEQLAAAMRDHERHDGPADVAAHPACLVCQMLAGAADG